MRNPNAQAGARPPARIAGPVAGSAAAAALLLATTAISFSQVQEDAAEPARGDLAPIDWDAVERDAEEAGVFTADPREGATLSTFEGGGAAFSGLSIPVLLPSSIIEAGQFNQLDEPLEVVARRHDYSAEAKIAPRSYQITGTRFVFDTAEGAVESDEPSNIFVEQAVYGMEASFERYGAFYTITIYCADPVNDPECVDEARARALAEEMIIAP